MTDFISTPQPQKFKTACWTCRGRKVKCDKVLPCRNCITTGIVCSFPPQVRTVQRPKRSQSSTDARDGESILDRCNRLEALLRKHAPDLRVDDANEGLATVSDEDGAQREEIDNETPPSQRKRPRILGPSEDSIPYHHSSPDTTRPVSVGIESRWDQSADALQTQPDETGGNQDEDIDYWNRLEEECASQVFLKAPSTSKFGSSRKHPAAADQPSMATNTDRNATGTTFPFYQPNIPVLPPLPTVSQRQICWKRYVENVDPLLKILHKPTMEKLLAAHHEHHFGFTASTEALIQAVCLLAVISMSEDDVLVNFGSNKETLTRSYASLTEHALMAANFLDAQDMTTVQALLLYLYYLKHKEDTRLHTLCSVAVCLATRMKLNQDGASLGLPRLQVELRRRLWWQLVILVDHPDFSNLGGLPHSFGANTRLPQNTNDAELEHHEARATEQDGGFTELSFCLMQYEITQTFNQIKLDRARASDDCKISIEGAEQRLHYSRELMQSRYFQDNISERPIGKFAADVLAMILAKRRILMHFKPDRDDRSCVPRQVHDNLFLLGIHVLELSRGLQTTKNFEKWRWLSTTYFQWSVANLVVKDLAIRQRSTATRRAWRAIDGLLDLWPESTRNSSRAATLKGLIADALRTRETETLWKMSPSLGMESSSHYWFPPETARFELMDKEKKRETLPGWMTSTMLPGHQHGGASPLSHVMDMENLYVPDLNYDENLFGFGFRPS